MDKLKYFITPVAAAFMMASMSAAQASDSSVTILPAEGNVQCNDYAANKVILSMDTRSAVYGITTVLTGPENPNDADNTGEDVSYFITPDGTTLSFFDSTTPIDYAVLKSGQTVSVLMYEIGGIFGDSNMTIPGGLSIDAFSLCYGLGNDPLNQAPVLDPIGNQSVTAGETLTFNVSAHDTDLLPNGGAVTITMTDGPENLPPEAFVDNGDGTGSFSWTTLATDVGSYTVTFIASDGDLTDSETITISVNSATPTCQAINYTLDDTGIDCPDAGRVLVCNIELDKDFYGLIASDSCCVCNNNDSPLQKCDPDLQAGEINADGEPACTMTTDEKTAYVEEGGILRPAEVSTHIELNNDPYYCTIIGGRRTCYRY
jgi:hypothetical protein